MTPNQSKSFSSTDRTERHTPGPWTVGYPLHGITGPTASPLVWWDGTGVKSHVITRGDEVVALLARSGPLTEQQHADARLIAAAPELLEALKKVRDFADSVHAGEYGWGECTRDELVEQIDALIKRATA